MKERLARVRAKRRARNLNVKSIEDVDFPTFCSLLEIRTKEAELKSFAPEHWYSEQKRFEAQRCGRDLVIKPRQIGFSTIELARDLYYAIKHRGAQVLVISHDSDLVEQFFVTLKLFAEQLKELGLLPPTRYSTKREIVFRKGSAVRVVEAGQTKQAADKKGRSGTVHRLHATEVAFWGAAAETMRAVLNSVPANGEVVIESTANGAGGVFYEDVQAARTRDTGYKLHFYPWFEHDEYRRDLRDGFDPTPRDDWERKLRKLGCDDRQIAFWRSKVDDPKLGLEAALQEFAIDIDTCFRAAGDAWFEPRHIDAIAPMVREPIELMPIVWKGQRFPPAKIFAKPQQGRKYVIGADVSEGIAKDGSSATVTDAKTGIDVATWWSDAVEPGDFGLVLAVLGWMYNNALVAPARLSAGFATIRAMRVEAKYRNVYVDEDGRFGWLETGASRPVLWDELGHAIREGSTYTPDGAALAEFRTIIRDEDGKPRARGKRKAADDACRDDRFVSKAIAWQLRTRTPQRAGGRRVAGL